MKKLISLAAIAGLYFAAACTKHEHKEGEEHGHGHENVPSATEVPNEPSPTEVPPTEPQVENNPQSEKTHGDLK